MNSFEQAFVSDVSSSMVSESSWVSGIEDLILDITIYPTISATDCWLSYYFTA